MTTLASPPSAKGRRALTAPAAILLGALACSCLLIGLAPTIAAPSDSPDWNIDQGRNFIFFINMGVAESLSPKHGLASFSHRTATRDGVRYSPYHRFPVLPHLLVKLATLPFPNDAAARIRAARALMLALFSGAAALAWLAVRRLVDDEWIALAAVLLAFCSHYALHYSDMVSTEGVAGLFAVMLAFHGAAVFAAEGRFGQLVAKVCAALMFDWHVFALVGPLALLSFGAALWRRDWRSVRRHFALGAVALLFGAAVLGVNLGREHILLGGGTPLAELPSVRSALHRTGVRFKHARRPIDWPRFPARQLHRLAMASVPYAVADFFVDGPEAVGRDRPSTPGFAVAGAVLLATTLGLAIAAGSVSGRRKRRLRPPSPLSPLSPSPAPPLTTHPPHARQATFVALALVGPCWTLVMRHTTQDWAHDYEGMFHTGLPLAFFALTLSALTPSAPAATSAALRRTLGFGAAAVFAISVVFATKPFQPKSPSVAAAAEITRTLAADADAIVAIARDETALIPRHLPHYVERYLLLGLVYVHLNDPAERQLADWAVDERLAPNGEAVPSPTPGNRLLFLYRRDDYAAALAGYAALAARRRPDASDGPYEVHHLRNAGFGDDLLYVRRDCPASFHDRATPRFFLHVRPADLDNLPPHRRQQVDFAVMDFNTSMFWREGRGCYARRRLPDHPIASIRTGQFTRHRTPPGTGIRYENTWEVELQPDATGDPRSGRASATHQRPLAADAGSGE